MRENDFFAWRRDMLYRFQSAAVAEEVYNLLQQQIQWLEYDFFSLCIRHPVPFTRPKISLHATYPASWLKHYQSENYFAIDPVLKTDNYQHGCVSWNDELFCEALNLWDAARDHGLRGGITQCAVLPNRATGFLSVANQHAHNKKVSDDETELRLRTLIELSTEALLRLNDELVASPEMRFSKRELEILKWTAEGKTSAEIAIILSISENTVNFHQKNMQRKFNAPNKTQIACYAVAIGLI